MASTPVLTFKAGKCDFDSKKVKPIPTPGYIYLYVEDELTHFCWRPRSTPAFSPDLDLLMIPGDGSFTPYTGLNGAASSENLKSPTNGRIFVLKFSSSSAKHFFWMQSKPQYQDGRFSERDQKLGQVVDMLLSGEEVDVEEEVSQIRNQNGNNGSGPDQDGDDAMEDVQGTDTAPDHHREGSGGAGADATGGDPREEGEESRRGGEDGGRAQKMHRLITNHGKEFESVFLKCKLTVVSPFSASSSAPNDASAIVQNFLNSLKGGSSAQQRAEEHPFTTLPDLLPSTTTVPIIESADSKLIDTLCSHLPPTLLLLAQEIDDLAEVDPNSETAQAAIQALSLDQKKDLLKRVLRSPQLHQSLGSLTVALRDGGLPTISEALGIKVRDGGYMARGGMPMGNDEAVEAFLEGVKKTVEDEEKGGEKMDTD
ncbi:proteasome complex subunit Rpn13 ubiquitin receptor-domain-containing protein [Cryomyces antarcticus]|uniref:Pru domain-containing protein n=1 Tax=Cryomyces antarcticus TaxID=329879 RepID=A0ABR0LZX5_9PEZI|nr:hypothetical protein LTR60_003650 [Cryomyces antarcticus]KAK5016232.1 hypothetical protein LTR39_002191 [Cryomyces antarcticus]KAK5169980.1 hypothetical protein LTR04_005370 [Oleoguttula sp. CCFEE 6159]KAK5256584.1 hypothetical protein LTR16_002932 [Cryomyces antarcticus]